MSFDSIFSEESNDIHFIRGSPSADELRDGFCLAEYTRRRCLGPHKGVGADLKGSKLQNPYTSVSSD